MQSPIIDESKMTSFSKFNPFRKNNDSSSMTTATTINNKNHENKGSNTNNHSLNITSGGSGSDGGTNTNVTSLNLTVVHSLVTPMPATHVAKMSMDPLEGSDVYCLDVAMQKQANRFASTLNPYDVPKKLGFLDCWVVNYIYVVLFVNILN